MVVPFPKDATQIRDADKLTRRALPWRPADSVAALIKGTTINGALRLAAKRHESAQFINLTWAEAGIDVIVNPGALLESVADNLLQLCRIVRKDPFYSPIQLSKQAVARTHKAGADGLTCLFMTQF